MLGVKALLWCLAIVSPLGLGTVALAQSSRTIQTPAAYNACNVRGGPGVNYSTVGTFPDGTVVTLSGERVGGWYAVEVGDTVGWIARQCLGL